ncbi:MAG: Maf family protein [Desulfobacterales bacterium]|nr:Maf family protein [Desulfobacterales bacterium]
MEPASFFTTKDQLILASGSPRRQDFLRELGLAFGIEVPAVEEIPRPAEPAEDFVRRMAVAKADAVARRFPRAWVLAADTVVVLDNDILGKPASPAMAGRKKRIRPCAATPIWQAISVPRVRARMKSRPLTPPSRSATAISAGSATAIGCTTAASWMQSNSELCSW